MPLTSFLHSKRTLRSTALSLHRWRSKITFLINQTTKSYLHHAIILQFQPLEKLLQYLMTTDTCLIHYNNSNNSSDPSENPPNTYSNTNCQFHHRNDYPKESFPTVSSDSNLKNYHSD